MDESPSNARVFALGHGARHDRRNYLAATAAAAHDDSNSVMDSTLASLDDSRDPVPGAPSVGAFPGDVTAALVQALFVQSPFSVGLYDLQGRVAAANPAYERHWGITLSDVPPDYSLFTDVQLEKRGLLALITRAYTGESLTLPTLQYDAGRATGKTGRTVWTRGHCYPVRDANGAVAYVAIVHEDVTARVESEIALVESEARYRDVVAHASDAIFIANATGRYIDVNVAACNMLGYTREQLLTMSAADLIVKEETGRLQEARVRFEEHGRRGVVEEWNLRRADGTVFPVEISSKILPDGRWQAIIRDATARKEAERERERLLAAAEEANRAKGEFLAVMSHELRTPLNAIGGYAELMEMGVHGPITPQQREDLRRMQYSQKHLLGLINEVLNYARLESGAVAFDLAPIALSRIVLATEGLILPQLRTKGLTLTTEVAPDVCVIADGDKLQQVLLNILSNALKFTDPGGHVDIVAREEGERVLLTVRDTGIGIAADQLERIFEPFVQVNASLTRTTEGTGLGLAISRDLARGMNGELTVTSEVGEGSAFTVSLPRAVTPASASSGTGSATRT